MKTTLQSIMPHLDKDIDTLVEDAERIRVLYRQIKGQLPTEVETLLIPLAYIESHQPQLLQARAHLDDRTHQEELSLVKTASKSRADALNSEIGKLEDSRPSILAEIDRLKAHKIELEKQVAATAAAIVENENKLCQLLGVISEKKLEMKLTVCRAIELHKKLHPIPRSVDED
ncbi:unnamed protein product [Urochloa decumbens]|uniref:DUF1409 domain-containing protein n=1 Tax=Urochloa decumbens TaxID=240449 RepID=A0ABC9B2Q2_9POAL